MTTKEVNEQNEKFQKQAVQLSELVPSGGLINATSHIIRNCREIQENFGMLFKCASEYEFGTLINEMEECIDEVVFILDQMEISNRKREIRLIDGFLKDGYNLLSVYSMWLDQLIKERIYKEQ